MNSVSQNTEQQRRRRRARRARRDGFERRFRVFGFCSIILGCVFLLWLLSTMVIGSLGAFSSYHVKLDIDLRSPTLSESSISTTDFRSDVTQSFLSLFPSVTDRKEKRNLRKLISVGSAISVRESLLSDSSLLGSISTISVPLSDIADLYFKGLSGDLSLPESERKISDRHILWLDSLDSAGRIEWRFNYRFFTGAASREPEMAGIWGAVVGSFFTLVITLFLSFPIGVFAAIYLEEFAPKNRFTDIIEININNLAAVPSIVFGLLGLGIFISGVSIGNFVIGGFAPRSAAITGGMVLALMSLPTIIIATRASLKSVPPSIREAALGVGASQMQVVLHHTLPLALPGILTGTILAMARALGETAPLLMVGMVAFIADIPASLTDPATVLPVQIYMWADFPEIGFQQKTSAATLILLLFLILMNGLAVFVRHRFERRW